MQMLPALPDPAGTSSPFSSKMTGWMPGMLGPALPAFIACIAGNVLHRNPPVSVCHHVSQMTASRLPTTLKYHCHTSGSMGSPTVVMCLKW